MYGFGGVGLSEVQLSISELSVVGGGWVGGGLDKRTSWSDLHRVRQKQTKQSGIDILLICSMIWKTEISLE